MHERPRSHDARRPRPSSVRSVTARQVPPSAVGGRRLRADFVLAGHSGFVEPTPTPRGAGRILFLNGASSSGKSTPAKSLQAALDEPLLHVSSDQFVAASARKTSRSIPPPASTLRPSPRSSRRGNAGDRRLAHLRDVPRSGDTLRLAGHRHPKRLHLRPSSFKTIRRCSVSPTSMGRAASLHAAQVVARCGTGMPVGQGMTLPNWTSAP